MISPFLFRAGLKHAVWTLPKIDGLNMLMQSDETGPCLLHEEQYNRLYIFNHIEYDSTSLAEEYWRDRDGGKKIEIPLNYFPFNNPRKRPAKPLAKSCAFAGRQLDQPGLSNDGI